VQVRLRDAAADLCEGRQRRRLEANEEVAVAVGDLREQLVVAVPAIGDPQDAATIGGKRERLAVVATRVGDVRVDQSTGSAPPRALAT
jgi:hypothetical protein